MTQRSAASCASIRRCFFFVSFRAAAAKNPESFFYDLPEQANAQLLWPPARMLTPHSEQSFCLLALWGEDEGPCVIQSGVCGAKNPGPRVIQRVVIQRYAPDSRFRPRPLCHSGFRRRPCCVTTDIRNVTTQDASQLKTGDNIKSPTRVAS